MKALWIIFVLAFNAYAVDPCAKTRVSLEREKTQLANLEKQQADLNREFSETVQRDFASQVEGIIDELDRNKARKVAFARRRLSKNIETTRGRVATLKKDFCGNCASEDESGRNQHCQ